MDEDDTFDTTHWDEVAEQHTSSKVNIRTLFISFNLFKIIKSTQLNEGDRTLINWLSSNPSVTADVASGIMECRSAGNFQKKDLLQDRMCWQVTQL